MGTQAERILDRLKLGPATSIELNEIAFRYSARIDDLRKKGYIITSQRLKQGVWQFTLKAKATYNPLTHSVALPGFDEPLQKLEALTMFDVPQKKPNQDWR